MVSALISKVLRLAGRQATFANKKVNLKKLEVDAKKLDNLETKLENVTDELLKETEEIEGIKRNVIARKTQFSIAGGQLSILALQDVVGAAFGALFFVITSEIWEISSRLAPLNLLTVVLLSFFMGFSLIYFSRRRKLLSIKVFHTCFVRAVEIYTISFLTSLWLVMIFNTAPAFEIMMRQTIVITLPAVITASTADLLFY